MSESLSAPSEPVGSALTRDKDATQVGDVAASVPRIESAVDSIDGVIYAQNAFRLAWMTGVNEPVIICKHCGDWDVDTQHIAHRKSCKLHRPSAKRTEVPVGIATASTPTEPSGQQDA